MRRVLAALFLGMGGCVSYPADTRPTLSVDDVVRLHEAGVDSGTLLLRIRDSRLSAPVTTDDVLRLKNANVPDPVIQAYAEAAPTRVTVVERPVYVEPAFSFRYGYAPYRYYRPYGRPYYYRHYHPRPRYYHRPR